MKKKVKNVKNREIKLSPLAILIFAIIIIALAIVFVIHDAAKVDGAFTLIKKLYTALFK